MYPVRLIGYQYRAEMGDYRTSQVQVSVKTLDHISNGLFDSALIPGKTTVVPGYN